MAVEIFNSDGSLYWRAGLDTSGFEQGANRLQRVIDNASLTVVDRGRMIDDFFKKAGQAAAGFFSLQAGKNFIQQMIQVRGEFQDINSAFETMLGSKEKADKLMAEATKLAANTPFSLTDVASGAKQLLAYGFGAETITTNLTNLGNIASGLKVPLGDLIYLYGTLKASGRVTQMDINQFAGRGIPIYKALADVLKVNVDEVRNLVSTGKVGFPQIEQAFKNMTSSGGQFFDLMDKQSKNLNGRISNLGDAFDQMLNSLGEQNEGLFIDAISGANALVNNYQQVISIIEGMIVVYGVYRAALIVTALQERILTTAVVQRALATAEANAAGAASAVAFSNWNAASLVLGQGLKGVARSMSNLMNATGLANPYVAAAVAIAAGGIMTYKAFTSEVDYAAKASGQLSGELIKERSKLDEVFDKLKSTKTGTEQRKDAVKDLISTYRDYLPNMDFEKLSLKELEDLYGKLNVKLEENVRLRVKRQQTDVIVENTGKSINDQVERAMAEIGSSGFDTNKAQRVVNDLIAKAQKKSIRLGAGNNWGDAAETDVRNVQKFVKQILGVNDLSKVDDAARMVIGDALNNIQIAVDREIKAKESLNRFTNAVFPISPKSGNGPALTPAQQAEIDRANRFTAGLKDAYANYQQLIKDARGKGDFDEISEALTAKARDLTATVAPDEAQIKKINARVTAVGKIIAKYTAETAKHSDSEYKEALQKRNAFYEKVAQLTEQSLLAGKSQDEREILQVKLKYAELTKEAKKLKIDPATVKINGVTGIDKASTNEQNDKRAKQQLEKDKVTYEARKELFVKYEEFVKQFGQQAANEQFKDQLGGFKNYLDFIDDMISKTKGKTDALSAGRYDWATNERPKALKEQREQNFDYLKGVLSDTQTYEQKLLVLKENYEKAALAAALNGDQENVEIAKESYKQQVDALNESHQKRLRVINNFNENVAELNRQQALNQISALRQLLEGANSLTEKQRSDIEQKAKQLENALSSKNGLEELTLVKLKDNAIQLQNELDELKTKGGSFEALKQKADELAQAQDEVSKKTNELKNIPLEKLKATGEALSAISNSLNDFDPAIAKVVSGLGNFAVQMAKVIKAGRDFKTQKATFSDYAGAIAAGASFLAGTIGGIASAAQQRKEAETAYYNAIVKSQNDYNLSLNEEIRLRSELSKNLFVKDYKGTIVDGTEALVDANKKYNNALQKLSEGKAKLGQRDKVDISGTLTSTLSGVAAGAVIGSVVPVIGTAIGAVVGGVVGLVGGLFSKKKKDVFGGLLDEYPELIKANGEFNESLAQSLIANNLVDDATKAMLDNTLALAQARQKAIEQINGVIIDLAGSLGDDLRNSLVNAFKEGTDSAKAFGDSVSKVIENIVAQFLFQEVFGSKLKDLQDRMKDSFKVGGDQNFVDDLVNFYKDAAPQVKLLEDSLKAARDKAKKEGIDIFSTSGNKTDSPTGKISAAITEATANEITGIGRGIQQNTYFQLMASQQLIAEQWQRHRDVMAYNQRKLESMIRIEANTRRNADVSEKYLPYLENIDKSSTSSLGQLMRAFK